MHTSFIRIPIVLFMVFAVLLIYAKGCYAVDKREKIKAVMRFHTFLDSPEWTRAGNLGAIQKIEESALNSGVTIDVSRILVDVDKTYIVTRMTGEHEEWEIFKATLTDEKGRKYDFEGSYKDCGVLLFEPLNEDTHKLTLLISEIGLRGNEGGFTSAVKGKKIELPADVVERLRKWGLYNELWGEETPEKNDGISQEKRDELIRAYYKETLKGEWRFILPVSTEPRERLTSSKSLDIKVPLMGSSFIFKKLTKGICQWFLEYDIVDREGKNEGQILRDLFFQLVREAKSKEEFMKKVEEKESSCSQHLLPEFAPGHGPEILWNGKRISANECFPAMSPGEKCLSFTPPEKSGSWAFLISALNNVRPSSPLEFKIDLENSERVLHFPVSIPLGDFIINGSVIIKEIIRDYQHQDEGDPRGRVHFNIREFDEENREIPLKKSLRLIYAESLQSPENVTAGLCDISCIDTQGREYDYYIATDFGKEGTAFEFIGFPSSSKTAVLRVKSLVILFDPPIKVPIE